ncbi:hypothetical protein F4604DRAFT_1687400 [Suillus subluteus]|nr:hypothetical protein F4604DRAFT_1687400 [Suillus subluteus]
MSDVPSVIRSLVNDLLRSWLPHSYENHFLTIDVEFGVVHRISHDVVIVVRGDNQVVHNLYRLSPVRRVVSNVREHSVPRASSGFGGGFQSTSQRGDALSCRTSRRDADDEELASKKGPHREGGGIPWIGKPDSSKLGPSTYRTTGWYMKKGSG